MTRAEILRLGVKLSISVVNSSKGREHTRKGEVICILFFLTVTRTKSSLWGEKLSSSTADNYWCKEHTSERRSCHLRGRVWRQQEEEKAWLSPRGLTVTSLLFDYKFWLLSFFRPSDSLLVHNYQLIFFLLPLYLLFATCCVLWLQQLTDDLFNHSRTVLDRLPDCMQQLNWLGSV